MFSLLSAVKCKRSLAHHYGTAWSC